MKAVFAVLNISSKTQLRTFLGNVLDAAPVGAASKPFKAAWR
ncbi:hypothetical protein M798_13240 [Brucella melitensis ADMAS-G1]|nr:hypothetical protein M798_13240 [Brucella melitensis ADMAS-G1]